MAKIDPPSVKFGWQVCVIGLHYAGGMLLDGRSSAEVQWLASLFVPEAHSIHSDYEILPWCSAEKLRRSRYDWAAHQE